MTSRILWATKEIHWNNLKWLMVKSEKNGQSFIKTIFWRYTKANNNIPNVIGVCIFSFSVLSNINQQCLLYFTYKNVNIQRDDIRNSNVLRYVSTFLMEPRRYVFSIAASALQNTQSHLTPVFGTLPPS